MEYQHFAQHKLHPLSYHRQSIAKGQRVDGRQFDEFRPITLQASVITTANGSALVRQGNTTVIAAVKAELGEPEPLRPNEGLMQFSLELNIPVDSMNEFSTPDTQLVTQELQQLFDCGQLLNMKDLCIAEGKLVWTLYCDLVCVDYGGSLLDCCLLSVLSALLSAKLPLVSMEDGQVKVNIMTQIPLTIQSFPVAISFLVVDDKLLVDPSDEEEKLFTGRVKIICSADNIHSVKKSGIKLITSNLMDECLMRAKSRQKAVRQMVDEVIVKAGQKSK